jgi:DNA-binding beta-propeller fold protein YncE
MAVINLNLRYNIFYRNYFFTSSLRGILLTFFFVALLFSSQAQDKKAENNSLPNQSSFVEWIGQYPALPGESADRKFTEKVFNFITGKGERIVLSKPVAVMAMSPDTFWILDQGNGQLFRVQKGLGEMTHFKKNDFKNFPSLVGIVELPGDSLLFTDSYLNKIFVSAPGKKETKNLNDSLVLEQPTGIAYSAVTGEIWVVETKAHRISILDKKGRLLRQIGGRGEGPGKFNFPTSIWIDNSGRAYVIDALNFRIQVFSGNGDLISVFGKIGDATGSFARPRGIATDSYGNIYVSDALFNAVQIFDIYGNFLYTFGRQGHKKGEFWMPAGIFIDHKDNIYVADSYNSRVQVFHLTKEDTK